MPEPIVLRIHANNGREGERIVACDTNGRPMPVEWDRTTLEELDSLTVFGDPYELNEKNELVLSYADPNLRGTPEVTAVLKAEHDRYEEILAKAVGKESSEVIFAPCSCLLFEALAATRRIVIAVPTTGYMVDPFADAPMH